MIIVVAADTMRTI